MRTGVVISAEGHKSSVSSFAPMVHIGDSTVIRRIIIMLKRSGIDPVVVVTGENGDELEKHIASLRVICLRNQEYQRTQMFYSICMGLNYIEDLCDRVFILPAKFPLFLPETISRMMESEAMVTCPVFEGRRGHPVLVSNKLIGRILRYKGDFGLRGAIRQMEGDYCTEEITVEDQGIILSIESDEDRIQRGLEHERLDIYPQVQLTLERDEGFFGPSVAQFLSLIDHSGSMQTGCRQMHMSYSKGWKILKSAEQQLGFPLLITHSGGTEGGSSQLTPKARDYLERFLQMEKELTEDAQKLYYKYFQ